MEELTGHSAVAGAAADVRAGHLPPENEYSAGANGMPEKIGEGGESDLRWIYSLLTVPRRPALICAMVFAASDSTRITRTPRFARSTSAIVDRTASRSVLAARSTSMYATPSDMLSSMSPPVAS